MKTFKIFFSSIFAILVFQYASAQSEPVAPVQSAAVQSSDTASAESAIVDTAEVKVYGVCGMCRSRIVKTALKIDGVKSASWDRDTKMLTFGYDASMDRNSVLDKVQSEMAAVGHDTDKYRASDEVYNKLPGCCHYDRKPADQ